MILEESRALTPYLAGGRRMVSRYHLNCIIERLHHGVGDNGRNECGEAKKARHLRQCNKRAE